MKKNIIGVFANNKNLRHKLKNIKEYFNNVKSVYIIQLMEEETTDYILTFLIEDYVDLNEFSEKTVILHKKEGNILFTINGLNAYLGGDKEDNKNISITKEQLGENVLLTLNPTIPDGYKIIPTRLHMIFNCNTDELKLV